MFEQISNYSTSTQTTNPKLYGLSKILTVGYDQNKSQRLPSSRYSLKISVIGLGTTGAATGIGLAALGHKVIAVDHDHRKVNAVNQGRVSSVDLKLKALLKQVRRLNNLVASCDMHHAILSSEVTMLCTGNSSIQKPTSNLNLMNSALQQISATLSSKQEFHLLVICQTTADADFQRFVSLELEYNTGKTLGKDFGLCFMPLELKAHQEISDFYSLPNMTVSISDPRSEKLVKKLFNGFKNKIKYLRVV
ncbi:hypothetical protein [Paraglaciecola arctica]|uniref:hypothetical protein n=1 Tax=Paraglaciecola arctica TaxID=1128911 RepID=UPI001C069065|nr:hypothetical protein [Paraglaciecola arctica]MBU3003339.1 hypothetical protein [Paraglaciecola arctica]